MMSFRTLFAAVFVLLAATTADAALTTAKCLVLKRQAWTALRKCEGAQDLKRLKGKTPDFEGCRTKLQQKLTSIDAKALKAVITCRYGANGNGTITDYDTALMWEAKDGEVGGLCLFLPDTISHCVNSTFSLSEAFAYVGGRASGGVRTPFLAEYTDWRLPTVVELDSIYDPTVPGCAAGVAPCIDPIFPTLLGYYWTASSNDGVNGGVVVNFYGGFGQGPLVFSARAVRGAF